MANDKMWKKYKTQGDPKIKNKLIEHYIYLVKIVAGRLFNFYGGNIEYDELLSWGIFGLIDAIEKYDMTRENKFETYAQVRIRGAIIDQLRKEDWVPRGLRSKAKKLETSINKLENELGRSATSSEIATALDINLKELEKLLSEISTFNVLSLEECLNNKMSLDLNNEIVNSPEKILEKNELTYILKDCIASLPDKEMLIISMYYYDELTYKEIAEIVNLSESRISQIHSKAILSIRKHLKEEQIIDR